MPQRDHASSLLFAARFVRLFAYGALSVVLVFYLIAVGLTEYQTGLLLSLTLFGDTAVSLVITTRADRLGRRRMLLAGAVLMVAAGLVFSLTTSFWLLLLAATIGVISPSGQEVGPFLPIEQAILAHRTTDLNRTQVFAWYTLIGALATATGALAGGLLTHALEHISTPVGTYRAVVILYAGLGALLAAIFWALPGDAAADRIEKTAGRGTFASLSGIDQSRPVVMKLAALFGLDAFGGGFIAQSFAAYWFHLRFGLDPGGARRRFSSGRMSSLDSPRCVASRLAARFGLVRTMVWTHLPSNVLLILVPLMPTLSLAVTVLLVRFSISQMDVPTRQSYVMAVVAPEERAAAGGITGVARTLGAAISPLFVGVMFAHASLISVPFFLAGSLKILYDLLLYKQFVGTERARSDPRYPGAAGVNPSTRV